ncbi:TylF/MycF/NovP-related O-methyltransferase [Nocardioides sp. zg-DK7169]|uniref:TylF/MycF/NovP-related O-methyltransferase n=1 Tax=Nocardioides sp. zg-DK7169 TaxID=2736600 RepID=UPI001557724D|nr:TylF/MycF/NovP-related O-methyltransferase [Nocardioides sp. zg-DK7169]NPC97803.1 asparagine synthase [Nocardioides sp. zg-DK7169]
MSEVGRSQAGSSTLTEAREMPEDVEELQRRLKRVRRRLKTVESELRSTTSELRRVRGRLSEARHDLPEDVERTIRQVTEEKLSFLGEHHLRNLATVVRDIEAAGIPGVLLETGTARGGSAIVIAAAKAAERPLKVYDVFDTIPPPGEQDGEDVHERYRTIAAGEARGLDGEVYYGYREDLHGEVRESFARLGCPVEEHAVDLVKGLFEDTVRPDGPVAFAHLDGDWYDSTMVCLERIVPRLSVGGRLVIDDYYNWSGCQRAVHDYFEGREGFELLQRAKLHVVRLAP